MKKQLILRTLFLLSTTSFYGVSSKRISEEQKKNYGLEDISASRTSLAVNMIEIFEEKDPKGERHLKIIIMENSKGYDQDAVQALQSRGYENIGFYWGNEVNVNKNPYKTFGNFDSSLFEKRSMLKPALWIAGGGLLLGAAYLYQNPEVAEKLQQRSLELYGQHMAPLFAAAREGFGGYMQKFGETAGGYWPFKK